MENLGYNVIVSANLPYLFSAEAIRKTAYLLLAEHKKAALIISSGFKNPSLSHDYIQLAFYNFFGSLNDYHGISSGRMLGFNPTEPQITKGLAKFLQPTNTSNTGKARLKSFLLALLKRGSVTNQQLIKSLESDKVCSLIVSEEVQVKNGKRIDLLITWNPLAKNTFEYGVIIETKFGHQVTAGQLPIYRSHAQKIIKNKALILLTLDGKPSRNNREWQPMQWFTFMARWEKSLDDKDIDFTAFRRFIWQKMSN